MILKAFPATTPTHANSVILAAQTFMRKTLSMDRLFANLEIFDAIKVLSYCNPLVVNEGKQTIPYFNEFSSIFV